MASTKEMQARAKARKQTTQNCLAQSPNGDIKVYKVGSLDKFKELTGRLPYEFENMEYIGLQLADQVMSNMFGEHNGTAEKELYVGSWKDLVVEVNNRKSKGSKEYFGIRLGEDDVVVNRPAYHDTLTLTGIEAAFARFAMSANHIGWYANSQDKGVLRTSPFSYITDKVAFEYYHMAMFAAGELDFGSVYSYLD